MYVSLNFKVLFLILNRVSDSIAVKPVLPVARDQKEPSENGMLCSVVHKC